MSKELYVGNIPLEATEDDLRRLFAVSGKVSYMHLVTDPKTGQFKGCGYIKMSSEAEAKDAINCLDGARLLNRLISVSVARPQKPSPAPEGGAPRRSPPAKTGERSGGGKSGAGRKPTPPGKSPKDRRK